MRLNIWDSSGAYLILAAPTGVRYLLQSPETTIYRYELEGALVPVREAGCSDERWSATGELNAYFERANGAPAGRGAVWRPLSLLDAEALEAIAARHAGLRGLAVNRQKLGESFPGWVHVELDLTLPRPELTDFRPGTVSAVLAWRTADLEQEPQVHSHINDGLPTRHPMAWCSVACKKCGAALHAGNNECLQTWVEMGRGSFCARCFGALPEVQVLGSEDGLR